MRDLSRILTPIGTLLLVLTLFSASARAENVSLLADINQEGPNDSSDPYNLTAAGENIFLTLDDGLHGRELWKSDGTSSGTVMVKDIVPGSASVRLPHFTNVDGILYFVASQQQSLELWKSDGTPPGTLRVKQFPRSELGPSGFGWMRNFLGRAMFVLDTKKYGRELWITDGTEGGTRIVKDISRGASGSSPGAFAVYNSAAYFAANDSIHGFELWRSDGTESGTTLVSDILAGSGSSYPHDLRVFNHILYFGANDGAHGDELWKSNGYQGGASMVIDINKGPGNSRAAPEAVFKESMWVQTASGLFLMDPTEKLTRVLISADVYVITERYLFIRAEPRMGYGDELWRSDGTAGGTIAVSASQVAKFYYPNYITRIGNRILFVWNDQTWISDGTPQGTVPFALNHFEGGLAAGSRTFFSRGDPLAGVELWITDGTIAGTHLVKDVRKGNGSSSPDDLVSFHGMVYFTAEIGVTRYLFKSDGTSKGTVLFDEEPTARVVVLNDSLILDRRNALWVTNGDPANTVLLKESLKLGQQSTTLGNRLIFAGISPNQIDEAGVWSTDGTAAGTFRINGEIQIPQFDNPRPEFVKAGGFVFLQGFGRTGNHLWVTDGTTAGTRSVNDLGNGYSAIEKMVAYRNQGYFTRGNEVWKSDGTPAVRVQQFSGYALDMAVVEDSLVILTWDNPSGSFTLWWTHGEQPASGIVLKGNRWISGLRALNGFLLFNRDNKLWRSSGTSESTTMVYPVYMGFTSEQMGARVYFEGGDAKGFELWTTDGTSAGTRLIKDLYPGAYSSYPDHFVTLGSIVLFSAANANAGRELWKASP